MQIKFHNGYENSTDEKQTEYLRKTQEEEFEVFKSLPRDFKGTIENLKKDKSDLSSRIASLEQEYRLKNSVYHKVEQELRNYEVTLGKYDTKMDYLLNLLSESYDLT